MRDFSGSTQALALNTATLGHNIPGAGMGWSTQQVIDACAELGFAGITFWRNELSGAKNLAVIGDAVRASGMAVSGLCRSPFLTGPLAPIDRHTLWDDFKCSIEQTAALQAECLVILTGGVPTGMKGIESGWDEITDILAKATEYAARMDVKLAIEPLHPMYGGDRSCIVTTHDALMICDRIGMDNLGVAIDVYHVWWDTVLDETLRDHGKGRVFSFHLCDWLSDTRDMLVDRGMMGDGVADIRHLRHLVEDVAGYNGLCEVEIFSERNWWRRDPWLVLKTCVERFQSVC